MPEDRFEVSRRAVLKGAGAAALIGAVSARTVEAKKPAEGIRRIGPGAVPIQLRINGDVRKLSVEPRVTLLDALRDRIQLTGTKRVCDRGACGACTVWIDGKTANACMTLAVDAQGAEIKTIEGLAAGGKLHPVQQAFIDQDALQCGFCTPGMIMSCSALYDRNKNPKPDEVKEAIAGNLCRCGTYPHIFRAMAGAGK